MKILKLKALNINSLKGEIIIDFTTFLNDNALFAITGPTGAGKSTILDIITCALYGRTPRLKNPNELMARHTGECLCEVEFEIKGVIYRSSWVQKRARKNAIGKFQTAKMELSNVETSKVIKSTLRDVPKYVEELSGLDFDRFIQSMMLAQGSFDAFLKAKESERSTLLEKITGTQIYAKISKEIYDRYLSSKSDIDSDKKILESTELLDNEEVEEKTKSLEESKKQKVEYDLKVKKQNDIKLWIETLHKLEIESQNYTELFTTISKEKEDNKEDFIKLSLANKALNVESIYTQQNSLENDIQKDEKTLMLLTVDLKELNEKLSSIHNNYERAKKETAKVKNEFDENSLKVKEVRSLQTQIIQKEENYQKVKNEIETKTEEQKKLQKKLDDILIEYKDIQKQIIKSKEYLETNKKDEKLLETLSLIQKDIQEFENENKSFINLQEENEKLRAEEITQKSIHSILENDLKDLKEILDSKNTEYQNLEKISLGDAKNEPQVREKINNFKSLLTHLKEYEDLKIKIENEEQQKSLEEKEITYLKENINLKQLITSELKTLIDTLRDRKDAELLIIKYEDDRKKLKENDECFLCGSTSHPYITNHADIDIDKTTALINEKETLYKTNENELQELNTKFAKTESKLESNRLEITKLTDQINSKKEIFEKSSILLDEETQVTLEEQILSHELTLSQILSRREEKDILLKQKENAFENYTLNHTKFLQSEKELDSIFTKLNQNKKDEFSSSIKLNTLKEQLLTQFKLYDLIFDELHYQDILNSLIKRKESFIENQSQLKELELKKNSYDLVKKENETKILSFTNEIVSHEENRVELESSIVSLKKSSLEILNVADIDIFERQIQNTFEKIQKNEDTLKLEFTTIDTKKQEYQKQSILLEEKINKNNDILKEFKQKLQTELLNNNFESLDTFKEAILVKDQREELSIKCKAIEDKYNEYQTLKLNTTKALEIHKKQEVITKPLDVLNEELKELNLKIEELQQKIGAVSQELKRDEEDRQKHQEKIVQLKKKQETFKVWVKLNEMIGSADGNKFTKFAQGITLDQLISLANNHLSVLSSRYELQRSNEQKYLLEIEVIDSFQGNVIRPVSTLSGGESFIVSLSLALGLSELASQKIAIDSLFLDEGFGTLDEDSLETALNALNLLQSSGKMVGVISHVEALKERIPLQIKVEPRGDGTSFIKMNE